MSGHFPFNLIKCFFFYKSFQSICLLKMKKFNLVFTDEQQTKGKGRTKDGFLEEEL